MEEKRGTDQILDQARAKLTAKQFDLFEFYMHQYQPLCLPENKTVRTIEAWKKLMTFLEERMHELFPPATVYDRKEKV